LNTLFPLSRAQWQKETFLTCAIFLLNLSCRKCELQNVIISSRYTLERCYRLMNLCMYFMILLGQCFANLFACGTYLFWKLTAKTPYQTKQNWLQVWLAHKTEQSVFIWYLMVGNWITQPVAIGVLKTIHRMCITSSKPLYLFYKAVTEVINFCPDFS